MRIVFEEKNIQNKQMDYICHTAQRDKINRIQSNLLRLSIECVSPGNSLVFVFNCFVTSYMYWVSQ